MTDFSSSYVDRLKTSMRWAGDPRIKCFNWLDRWALALNQLGMRSFIHEIRDEPRSVPTKEGWR